jgi:lipoyl(octanoyl) transferase
LEQVVIDCLQEYGLWLKRLEGGKRAFGSILGVKGRERKIYAPLVLGLAGFVTMHGLAFNVNTNLDYFRYINPCGFTDKGVTSMQEELNHPVDIEEVKERLLNHFTHRFHFACNRIGIV